MLYSLSWHSKYIYIYQTCDIIFICKLYVAMNLKKIFLKQKGYFVTKIYVNAIETFFFFTPS